MADIIVKKIGNNEYTFECKSVRQGQGFAHKVILRKNGVEIERNSVQYYNRTWESYQYQSAMLGCVSKLIEPMFDSAVQIWKTKNNKSRITKEQRQEVNEAVRQSKEYKELDLLRKMINDAHYGTEAEREEQESLDRCLKMLEIMRDMMKKDA